MNVKSPTAETDLTALPGIPMIRNMVKPAHHPSVFDLSVAEKLQLVEDLWDDLAATPDAVPVHDWQRAELDRRRANLTNHPAADLTWAEVKRRARNRDAD